MLNQAASSLGALLVLGRRYFQGDQPSKFTWDTGGSWHTDCQCWNRKLSVILLPGPTLCPLTKPTVPGWPPEVATCCLWSGLHTCCVVHQEHLYTLLPTPPSPTNSSPFLEYSSMVTSLGNLSSPLHPRLSEVPLFYVFGSPCPFPL